MTVWIKEFRNVLTLGNIQKFFDGGVSLKKISDWDKVNCENDLVIYSKKDENGFSSNCLCIKVEDFLQNLNAVINNDIQKNYDLYYLQNILNYAKNNRIDYLFLGCSHMLHGISEDIFPCKINASLPSQDLFYSLKIVKEIIKNSQIKTIIFGMSYAHFHWDLSLTGFPELNRVANVYYPIFNDYHNAILITETNEISLNSHMLNVNKMYEDVKEKIGIHYFNQIRSRESCRTHLWKDEDTKWSNLDKKLQQEAAYERTQYHNNLLKYNATYIENQKIFKELVDLCNKQHINLNIVILPATRCYVQAFDEKFKIKMYEAFENVGFRGEVLDLFTDSRFVDSDFVDTDHFSDEGAIKFSRILSDYFNL